MCRVSGIAVAFPFEVEDAVFGDKGILNRRRLDQVDQLSLLLPSVTKCLSKLDLTQLSKLQRRSRHRKLDD